MAVKQTHPKEEIGERTRLMTTQAEGDGEDADIIITEATILPSQGAIATPPTAEKNAGVTDRRETWKILVKCQMQRLITGMKTRAEEIEEAVQRGRIIIIIIIIDTDIVKVTPEVMALHHAIDTVKRSVMTLTLEWFLR